MVQKNCFFRVAISSDFSSAYLSWSPENSSGKQIACFLFYVALNKVQCCCSIFKMHIKRDEMYVLNIFCPSLLSLWKLKQQKQGKQFTIK